VSCALELPRGISSLDQMLQVAEKHRAKDLAVTGGGGAANAAVAVARLDGRAALARRIGDDQVGRGLIQELEQYGVDCRWSRSHPGRRSAVSAILVDGQESGLW